jgi:hypothetical protein
MSWSDNPDTGAPLGIAFTGFQPVVNIIFDEPVKFGGIRFY